MALRLVTSSAKSRAQWLPKACGQGREWNEKPAIPRCFASYYHRLEVPEIIASHEFPLSVSAAASRAIPVELPAAAVDHLGEIAAKAAAAKIFAVGDYVAAIGTAMPFIAPADRAVETVLIGTHGIAAVLAIHVARDGVAGEPPQESATDDRAA